MASETLDSLDEGAQVNFRAQRWAVISYEKLAKDAGLPTAAAFAREAANNAVRDTLLAQGREAFMDQLRTEQKQEVALWNEIFNRLEAGELGTFTPDTVDGS